MLTVDLLESPDHLVLGARGDIDLANQDAFEQVVQRHLLRASVTVDLSHVDFVSVSALSSFVRCHRFAVARGRRFVLLDPPAMVVRMLHMCSLDRQLEVQLTAPEPEELPSPPDSLPRLPRPR